MRGNLERSPSIDTPPSRLDTPDMSEVTLGLDCEPRENFFCISYLASHFYGAHRLGRPPLMTSRLINNDDFVPGKQSLDE